MEKDDNNSAGENRKTKHPAKKLKITPPQPARKDKKYSTTFLLTNRTCINDLMFIKNVCSRYGIRLVNIDAKDGKYTGEFENCIASKVALEYDKQFETGKREFVDASRLMTVYHSAIDKKLPTAKYAE